MPPSVFRSSLIWPFLPSAETRAFSSAVSSFAALMAARMSRSSLAISLMIRIHRYFEQRWMQSARVLSCAAGLIHQGLEGLGLVNGQIGKHLAVNLDPGLRKPADKSAVGQPVLAAGRVDALNPEGAEIALLQLAADI